MLESSVEQKLVDLRTAFIALESDPSNDNVLKFQQIYQDILPPLAHLLDGLSIQIHSSPVLDPEAQKRLQNVQVC